MPKDSSASSGYQPNDIVESGPKKGYIGGQITLHTYSDSVYYAHIGKVALALLIIAAIVVFIVVGLFYPECNATQDHGFYSCSCKDGSALDMTTGMCLCLDTGKVAATSGCPSYVANERRYIYADGRPSEDAENGGWVKQKDSCF